MFKKAVVGLFLGLATLASTGAVANDVCGSAWRTVTDPVAGAQYEMAAVPRRSYFISATNNFPSSTNEQEYFDDDNCATFSATVWDLGENEVSDLKGFFDTYQAGAVGGSKLIWSRSRKVDGFHAREFQSSKYVQFIDKLVTYRTLAVVRKNKVIIFNSNWVGDESSRNADRAFRSIRLIPQTSGEDIKTFALLSEAIAKYWMSPSDHDYSVLFAPALRTELDRRRDRDALIVKAFGYPRDLTVLRNGPSGKVVRVKHDAATVDWTVQENGKVLTAISWRPL